MSKLTIFDFRIGCNTYDTMDEKFIIEQLKPLAKKYVFQKEKGENTGYLHWQGRISLFKRATIPVATSMFIEQLGITKKGDWYFRPTSGGCKNFSYAMKLQTRIDGPWSDKDQERYIPYQYSMTPYDWQQAIFDTAKERDPRTINCIVDPEGGLGKSFTMGYGRVHFDFPFVNVTSDADRTIATVCDILLSSDNRDPKLIFVDIPRSFDHRKLPELFVAIEIIKSGIVSDTRYHNRTWIFDSPQVWVFCNTSLPKTLVSKDRWKFWTVDASKNLKPS